jgi:hypothetical protein
LGKYGKEERKLEKIIRTEICDRKCLREERSWEVKVETSENIP